MKSAFNILSLAALVMTTGLLGACNLAFDLDEYPYQGPLVINLDAGGDAAGDFEVREDADADAPDPPDMRQDADVVVGDPQLVITELLINTGQTAPGVTGEVGEYVEIKNIGDGPADPRAISFNIENLESASRSTISIPLPGTSEQVRIYGELEDIQPGEYFVFVRFETDEVPISEILETGTYFDWGRYGQDTALANGGERLLELRYFDGVELEEFDRVRWSGGTLVDELGAETVPRPLDEDTSLSVLVGAETPDANDAPENWCQETEIISGITTGTPGRAAACQ